jgi:hypothetical protein
VIVYSLIAINRGPMRPLVDVAVDTPLPEPQTLLLLSDGEALLTSDGEAILL